MNLWNQHMDEYKNYVTARKNNDEEGMNTARQNLSNISGQIGQFFDSKADNLSTGDISSLMQQHIDGTLDFIDAHTAYDQSGVFADVLTKGIIQDKPNMFQ